MVIVLKKKSGKSLLHQLDELLRKKTTTKAKHNWGTFFGKVQFSENPVSYQRRLRDE